MLKLLCVYLGEISEMYKRYIKRILDFFLSLIAIIILSPVFLVISIMVMIGMGFPIIFSQERIGLNERPFKFYKYRSMTNARDKDGNLLDETQRITKFVEYVLAFALN